MTVQPVPFRRGWTLNGRRADGTIIGGRNAGDYYVEASFPGLKFDPVTRTCELPDPWPADNGEADARAWAAGVFARDPRVASFHMAGTQQDYAGEMWKSAGPFYVINRDDTTEGR